ncbi:LEA type 2 family protein [Nonlabens sp. Asnod3-A02]|uniref:LEA type 2 family protein n=1 Tax=Nonlabens sp. Asnod3-A02 TaxID=3160579 RepID=UPI003867ADDC
MKKLFILLVFIFLSSCGNPYEDIVFVEIKDAQLEKATASQLDVVATCVLYNPNSVGLNLKEADFDVYINGKKTAVVNQHEDVVMPANSEFEFPIRTSINPKEVYGEKGKGFLGAALQILASQKVDVKYQGSIKVGKGAVNFTVPVVDSLSVPVKFNF